jgi:GR25 family glycosyltransferase involved in LPS biosynthesis/glycosyltransferase involved in cell wall biosynthesis
MIVRDEAHVVSETLATVTPHIDHWVVVDTGSVDDTMAVVRDHFAAAGVPGELHERPWRDFGTNRTEALELARGRAEYTWVIDADDLVAGDLDLSNLHADAYAMRYGSEFVFWRTQLFRSSLPWRYEGVLHEYPVCDVPGVCIERLDGPYHLVWRTVGGRSRVADKFERDVALLAAAHEADPNDARTVFYLAQSHRDAGQSSEALQLYQRRVEMGGWEEEIYLSRLESGRAMERLGSPWPEVQAVYLEAWSSRPTRGEALFELARRHREAGDWAPGHLFATRGLELTVPGDDLFVEADVHRWRFLDEASICAYYLGRVAESLRSCRRLLAEGHLPEHERARVQGNLRFALAAVEDAHLGYRPDLVARLTTLAAERRAGAGPVSDVTLTITAGRRRGLFEATVDSFLSCCDDVEDIGRWICVDEGSDPADRDVLTERYPFIEFLWKDPADAGHARSLNLLRNLVDTPWRLHLEDDWKFIVPDRYVGRAQEILDADPSIGQVLFNRCYAETLDDLDLAGGVVAHTASGSRYWRQEHFEGDELAAARAALPPGAATNAWWPHYSLRPSLLRTAAVHGVGPYDESSGNVELDFARRYTAAGFRTAAFDEITCLHTGPLTGEHGPRRRPNAYDLCGVAQFGAPDRGSPYRVRPLSFWASAAELVQRWDRQSDGGGRWGDIVLTANGEPDYWAVFTHPGTPMEPTDVPDPARTIVLRTEPTAGLARWTDLGEWTSPDPARFLQVRTHERFSNAAEWHLSLDVAQLQEQEVVKSRDLSVIVSAKHHDPGHRLRVAFVHHLETHEVPIDIFGFDNAHGFHGYLGPLPAASKDDGILPYRYTLAVENHAEPGYVTEKLFDAVLGEALAFYWGCPDLEDHLDPRCFIRLPLEDPDQSRVVLQAAIAGDEWSARIAAIRSEKRRILNERQIFPVLDRVVRGHRSLLGTDLRVLNLDRRPDRLAAFDTAFRARAGHAVTDRIRRVSAVDGRMLAPTAELSHLFRENDHGFRRGIVGCALSHVGLWRQVAAGGRPMLVLEDDVVPVEGFTGLLVEVCAMMDEADPAPDVVVLGAQVIDAGRDRASLPVGRPVHLVALDPANHLGGTYAYLLTVGGARRLLELVERDGIQQGIDWFLRGHADEVRIARCRPDLVTTVLAWPGRSGDSDIQHDFEVLPDPHGSG